MITTHALEGACALEASDAAALELSLTPLGDFATPDARRFRLAEATDLDEAIPEGTRAILGQLEIGSTTYVGYAERGASDELPILLWPLGRACRLDSGRGDYPADGDGSGLAYHAAGRSLLLAGGDDPSRMNLSVATLTVDLGTGKSVLSRSLSEPRAHASITAFGDGFLIAGGEDPWNSEGRVIEPSATAELFPLEPRGEGASSIALSLARTRHAASVLPNGDTLLVGGLDRFARAPNLLEGISRESRDRDVAFPALLVPRLFPSLLTLDDGRRFIGGGRAADESPLSALEWLSADARQHLGLETPEELPARHDRAFAAMPGGGVLVVGGCAPREPEPGEDCGMCRAGCPPRDAAGNPDYDAWWVLPDTTLVRLPGTLPAAPRPVLLGGSGRPVLAPGEGEALYRFDAWKAAFVEERELDVECPPRAGLPAISLDDATFAWVSSAAECQSGSALFGLRSGVASRYRGDVSLVPDRPPGDDAEHDEPGGLHFTRESSLLVFIEGELEDFVLDLELAGEAQPELVILASDGAGAQRLELSPGEGGLVRVERSGRELRAGERRSHVSEAPLHVGFASGRGAGTIRAMSLSRRLEAAR